MSNEERVNVVEEEEIDNLMAEGFSNPIPRRHRDANEVIPSNLRQGEPLNEIPKGVPLEPLVPLPPTSAFALWPCRVSEEATQSFVRLYNIDPSTYRVFVTPSAGKMSAKFIPIP